MTTKISTNLVKDAAITSVQTSSLLGGFGNVQVYTATGTSTWTKPTGLKRIKVTVVGGGGGGGGAPATGGGQSSVGSGGAGGGTSIKVIEAASLGATETVTVGAKGTGNSGTSGYTGGTSSFGSHCSATGGTGGTFSPADSLNRPAGTNVGGGIGSGGNINFVGSPGGVGIKFNGIAELGGPGGGSSFGGGASAQNNNSAGRNASDGYGGGGSGAAIDATSTAQAGGNGTDGIIIVEEFF